MIEGKKLLKELIRLLSVEVQRTKAFLTQTCMGVFFIHSVSDTIFSTCFIPEPPVDRHGPPVVRRPQFEKHRSSCTCI
jgi:hypothetical protein